MRKTHKITKSKIKIKNERVHVGGHWSEDDNKRLQKNWIFPPLFQGKIETIIKGVVHPKMKILSLITHPHAVPNH